MKQVGCHGLTHVQEGPRKGHLQLLLLLDDLAVGVVHAQGLRGVGVYGGDNRVTTSNHSNRGEREREDKESRAMVTHTEGGSKATGRQVSGRVVTQTKHMKD